MKKVMVQYKVKAAQVAENEKLIGAVYKELAEVNLQGFHYATFKLEDGLSFVHVALADTSDANTQFSALPAFKKFQANIKDRCDEIPVVSSMTIIGSHHFEIGVINQNPNNKTN